MAQALDHDVDQLVWALRPTALDDLGLRAALANYVQDWSGRVGVTAEKAEFLRERRQAFRFGRAMFQSRSPKLAKRAGLARKPTSFHSGTVAQAPKAP